MLATNTEVRRPGNQTNLGWGLAYGTPVITNMCIATTEPAYQLVPRLGVG